MPRVTTALTRPQLLERVLPGCALSCPPALCTKRDTYPDGREFVGIGVIPDVEVHPTPADIAARRDVVLAKGVEVLKAK